MLTNGCKTLPYNVVTSPVDFPSSVRLSGSTNLRGHSDLLLKQLLIIIINVLYMNYGA